MQHRQRRDGELETISIADWNFDCLLGMFLRSYTSIYPDSYKLMGFDARTWNRILAQVHLVLKF